MSLARWGQCQTTDADGLYCVLMVGHKDHHQGEGLRALLEATTDDNVMRTYNNPGANELFVVEARLFAAFGFYPVSQSGTSTTNGPGMGSIFALGILAFGRRTTSSAMSVMFRRGEPVPVPTVHPSVPSIPDQIRALGGLRDAGLLTADEFNVKKTELLARM
jgi:hypothetical protein